MEQSYESPRIGVRHVQMFLVFLSYLLNFLSRINCSFILVAITNSQSANSDFPEYNWNEQQISYIISSANIGAVVAMIPGSFILRKFGVKTTMAVSMFGSSILCLITPASIPIGGWQIFCVIRFVQGLFQGIFFPCAPQHLANWAPPNEVTRLGALSFNGVSVGVVVAMLTSGFIAKSSWGWPGISHFAGVLGLLWNVIWQIFGDSSPTTSKYISLKEKNFILHSQEKTHSQRRKIPLPWKAILTSSALWPFLIVNMATYWGHITILLEIPLYMEGVLYMDIKSNSIFSSIPFIAMFLMSFAYIYFYGLLLKVYSMNISKKIINTIATWVPAVALIWIGFLDKSQKELVVVLMIVIVAISGGVTIGSGMNNIELSPNHAAFLGSLSVTGKGLMSIIAPLLAGFIVSNKNERFQWQIVFMIAAVIYFFGNFYYIIFGTTARQPWDHEDFLEPRQEAEKEKKVDNTSPEFEDLIAIKCNS